MYGTTIYQNNRNGEIFKDGEGNSYWIQGKVFRDPDGSCFTSSDSRVAVTFPWTQQEPQYIDVVDESGLVTTE